jgi:ATP-dependent DNA helicase DinG
MSKVADELARVVAELPGGGEPREGQRTMAEAAADAISEKHHLVVQAGTGTGKTLAYLVPAILSGRRTVVATATKALQDQLAGKDLPFLDRHLGTPFRWAVLKGRSNYVCVQRLAEHASGDVQLGLDGVAERAPAEELAAIALWAATTGSGDRAELDLEPSELAWSAVSTSSRDCPGATRCPRGGQCFAEKARNTAAESDVIVVNLHLYGLHLATGAGILPEHDLVVIDEAHQMEEIISATSGLEITGGRFLDLARKVKGLIADDTMVAALQDAADVMADALLPLRDTRLRGGLSEDLLRAFEVCRRRVEIASDALRAIPNDVSEDVKSRVVRCQKAAGALIEDLAAATEPAPTDVVWVEGPERFPMLRVAPLDVAPFLKETLWDNTTAVLTSATIPAAIGRRLGLPTKLEQLDVGSPFDYQEHALLYCAAHLPDPRQPAYLDAMVDELGRLIEAAGGRTLALFTSWRAMERALEVLRPRLEMPVVGQRDLPKPKLLQRFTDEDTTCLFATMGFWQGVDVPGATLSLVAIDKLPFPRPDEPLLQARREQAGADAFSMIDLPRAATLLAQGAGRLIRSATDRGVVAVLDPRLATAGYRWDVINALPPMRRTKDPDEVAAFLRSLNP